jgi:tape measure domain-containing protein
MEQSQKLFGQVAKAGSIMGLSAQRMELIFLALEQMISKGTISAEELRRQLGDNLPSAMRTMADALGVTIPELMKMIKANKVLAEDALPKFGDQLEKQYGIEKVKTVHNLQTAVNDLKNEWTLFVAELKASDAFMTGLEKLGNYIQSIRIRLNPNDFIKSESLAKSQADYKEIITSLKTVNDAEKIRSGLTEKIQEAYKNYMGYVKVVNELSKQRMRTKDEEVDLAFATSQKEAYKKLGEELTKLLTSRTEFNKLFFPAKEPTPLVTDEELDNLKKALDEATGMIEKLEAEKALNDYKILKAKDESVIVKLNKENQVLDIQIKKLKDLGIEAERVRDAFIKIDENSVQGMADKANDAINKKRLEGISDNHRDAYNADLQRRLAFYRKVKKMDGENYEEQKAMLAQFHKDKVISDKEYFWTSTQLWMENNRATIDAAKELQEQAFNIANAIYDGKVAEAKREMDLYNEQIDALKDKLDKEKELKDQSKANDFDRLVSELHDQERLRNSAQKKYELYQKRQAQLKFLETQANLGVSVSEAFAASAGQGPAGWIAAIAAAAALIASFAAMQNQIKSIGKYAEGTEYLQRGNNPKGKDTIPVLANEGERIVPTDINSKLDGIDNDRLPEIYRFYKYNMIRGAGAVHTSSSADVIRELKRGRNVSEKMLNHFEDTPVGISLPDGRVMLKWGKNRTEIIELGKA